MRSQPLSSTARARLQPRLPRLQPRLAGAAVLALLTAALAACGPGGPKPKTDDGGGGGSGRTSGIALLAGSVGVSGGTDANGSSARFNSPRGIVIDSSGNLFVADQANFAIRKIAADGTVSTFAGRIGASGSANGNGGSARFSQPTALAIDAANNLFVTDNFAIRKITPAGDVSTLTTIPSGSGFGSNNQFLPGGIAVDAADNLFVTTGVDTRRILATAYASTTVVESGQSVHYSTGNDVLLPRGVAVDSGGVAYVADLGNTISSIPVNARVLSAFAGSSGTSGSSDGNASNVRFGNVVALTVDKDGNLYAADALNSTVRKITSKAVTSTVAGHTGNNALVTGGLPGSLADLRGITNDGNGTLYVTSGNAVVKITLP